MAVGFSKLPVEASRAASSNAHPLPSAARAGETSAPLQAASAMAVLMKFSDSSDLLSKTAREGSAGSSAGSGASTGGVEAQRFSRADPPTEGEPAVEAACAADAAAAAA